MARTNIVGLDGITKLFRDEMVLMVGGLHTQGTPEVLVDAILEVGA